MDKAIAGQHVHFVPINAEGSLLDALAELVDPQGLARESIEAIEQGGVT